jgi:hypothetical protein
VKIFGAIRQSNHMHEIQEENQKLIEESQSKHKAYIFYPDDKSKNIWSILLVTMLVLTAIITPFRVCFV